jgi:hypothetical protein
MVDLAAKTTIPHDMKPLILFQGEPFEMNESHKRFKNLMIGKCQNNLLIFCLLLDFFKMSDSKEINVVEMQRILVFTCNNNTSPIVCKHYEAGSVKEGEIK